MSGNELKSRKKKGTKKHDVIRDIPKRVPKAAHAMRDAAPEESPGKVPSANNDVKEVPEKVTSAKNDSPKKGSKAVPPKSDSGPGDVPKDVPSANNDVKEAPEKVTSVKNDIHKEVKSAPVISAAVAGEVPTTDPSVNDPAARKVPKAKAGKKNNNKKKIGRKVKRRSKKKVYKASPEDKAEEMTGTDPEEPPLNFNSLQQRIDNIRQVIGPDALEPPLNLISNPNLDMNQNPVIASDRFFHNPQKTNYFIIISILSIIIFLAAGYVYPATEDDMINGKVIWSNSAKSGGGLFSELYASIAFTVGVFMMGYYVNTTFIRFNVRKWNYFGVGILLIFFFGLGKIGELLYNHEMFNIFKDLVLPMALTVLAFASYKMYKDMNGDM